MFQPKEWVYLTLLRSAVTGKGFLLKLKGNYAVVGSETWRMKAEHKMMMNRLKWVWLESLDACVGLNQMKEKEMNSKNW